MKAACGRAFARAGLLGNPSDGYGGKAIAMTLENFNATATVAPCERLELVAGGGRRLVMATPADATGAFAHEHGDGGLRLMRAALRRFFIRSPHLLTEATFDTQAFRVRFATDIPEEVGLSGSSAIIIAVMRALMTWFDESISPWELAELALAAELEDLGLACGPMDRVIQAYEGVVVMDLREPRSEGSYTRLEAASLPPMFVAYDPRGGSPSADAHAPLRARWKAGDEEILRIMSTFRDLVDAGVAALRNEDHEEFADLMNRNFDLRTSFFPVAERDRQMVAIARRVAASGKLCGSGGAIVGQLRDPSDLESVRRAFEDSGFRLVEPRLSG